MCGRGCGRGGRRVWLHGSTTSSSAGQQQADAAAPFPPSIPTHPPARLPPSPTHQVVRRLQRAQPAAQRQLHRPKVVGLGGQLVAAGAQPVLAVAGRGGGGQGESGAGRGAGRLGGWLGCHCCCGPDANRARRQCCSPAVHARPPHLDAAQQVNEGGRGGGVAAPHLAQQRLAKGGVQRRVGGWVVLQGAQVGAQQAAQRHVVRPHRLHPSAGWLHCRRPMGVTSACGSGGAGGGGGGGCGARWIDRRYR